MKLHNIIVLLVVLGLFSCGEDDSVGPCVHTYKEPVFNVESIQDTINNVSLRFVKLYSLKIDNLTQNPASALFESYSVVTDDSVFYCNIPFGFGVEEGKYEFIIEAENYEPKTFTIENVRYSIHDGGCPSYSDGGMKLKLYVNE